MSTSFLRRPVRDSQVRRSHGYLPSGSIVSFCDLHNIDHTQLRRCTSPSWAAVILALVTLPVQPSPMSPHFVELHSTRRPRSIPKERTQCLLTVQTRFDRGVATRMAQRWLYGAYATTVIFITASPVRLIPFHPVPLRLHSSRTASGFFLFSGSNPHSVSKIKTPMHCDPTGGGRQYRCPMEQNKTPTRKHLF